MSCRGSLSPVDSRASVNGHDNLRWLRLSKPPLKNTAIEKLLIILDLDGTLIHATDKPHDDAWDFPVFHYKVYKRPHLNEFLLGLKEHFEVAVWSSASDDYVDLIVKEIFPQGYGLKFVWGRSRCTYRPNYNKLDEFGYYDPYSHYDYVKRWTKCEN